MTLLWNRLRVKNGYRVSPLESRNERRDKCKKIKKLFFPLFDYLFIPSNGRFLERLDLNHITFTSGDL